MTYPIERVIRIARTAYAANLAWRDSDAKHPNWDDAEDDVRAQYVTDVSTILNTQFANNATLHNVWMTKMTSNDPRIQPNGPWKYGKVYSEAAHTHPEIAPFHQLPPEKQEAHRLIFAVTQAVGQV